MFKTLGGAPISRICFGTLTSSYLQKNYSSKMAGNLYFEALKRGINFFDTAELYGNYGHFREFLSLAEADGYSREDIVIATKSYAYSKKTLTESVDSALSQMGTEYIDIFLLHEQESEHTLRGHFEALEEIQKLKESGIIRYGGISTHFVAGAAAGVKYNKYIDVLHPIINVNGFGIQDGSLEQMIDSIKAFVAMEGFVYAMKIFGGGNLLSKFRDCFDFAIRQDYLHSLAIGMSSKDEIEFNTNYINDWNQKHSEAQRDISIEKKKLHIADWCIGCGACINRCQVSALQMVDKMAVVDRSKCLNCGYCASVCPQLCIKIY